MDRLTRRTDLGATFGRYTFLSDLELKRAAEQLAAYEDTGLMPEEIAALKAENERLRVLAEKQTPCEINDYIDENYERHMECPICGL